MRASLTRRAVIDTSVSTCINVLYSVDRAHLPGGIPQFPPVREDAPAREVPGQRSAAVWCFVRRRLGVASPLRRSRSRHVPAFRQTQGRARLHRQGSG